MKKIDAKTIIVILIASILPIMIITQFIAGMDNRVDWADQIKRMLTIKADFDSHSWLGIFEDWKTFLTKVSQISWEWNASDGITAIVQIGIYLMNIAKMMTYMWTTLILTITTIVSLPGQAIINLGQFLIVFFTPTTL